MEFELKIGWQETFKAYIKKHYKLLRDASGNINFEINGKKCALAKWWGDTQLLKAYKPERFFKKTFQDGHYKSFEIDFEALEKYTLEIYNKKKMVKENKNVVEFSNMFFEIPFRDSLEKAFPEAEVKILNTLHDTKRIRAVIIFENKTEIILALETKSSFKALSKKDLNNCFWNISLENHSHTANTYFLNSYGGQTNTKLKKILKIISSKEFREYKERFDKVWSEKYENAELAAIERANFYNDYIKGKVASREELEKYNILSYKADVSKYQQQSEKDFQKEYLNFLRTFH